MSKKLLQINVTANWGSTGKIAEQIGLLAMERGWESYIAYGRMMNPSKSKLIKIGTQWDVYRHYAEGRFLDREGLASRKATKDFLKVVDEIKPDIVHLHNIHDHYINYPLLFQYLVKKKIPVVWTQHDQWATTGHCAFNLVGCEKWKTACGDCPVREQWALDRSKRNYELKKSLFTSLESLTIVPVSEWLGGEIKQSFLKNCPMRVIHNGIDLDVFKPINKDVRQKYGLGDKKIILGVANVWTKSKGTEDFAELSRILPDDWKIVLVGDTSAVEVPVNIICIHRTQNQEELVKLYSCANVLMSLSGSETFGLTIAEAMACGTPAIVYDNTAQPELLTEETGSVVESGNITAIVNLLGKYGERSNETAWKCRERAKAYYEKNRTYTNYVSLFDELIGGGNLWLAINGLGLKIVLGVASEWSERKGLKDLFRLAQMLPRNEYVILIVGKILGEKQDKPEDGCRMIFIERTQNQLELAQMYSAASVFVNPTYQDNYPTTNLEAMACGTPVITYRTGGSPEAVSENTGIVVEQGDVNGLKDAVLKLSHTRLTNECRQYAESYFDSNIAYNKYISLYAKLTGGGND